MVNGIAVHGIKRTIFQLRHNMNFQKCGLLVQILFFKRDNPPRFRVANTNTMVWWFRFMKHATVVGFLHLIIWIFLQLGRRSPIVQSAGRANGFSVFITFIIERTPPQFHLGKIAI